MLGTRFTTRGDHRMLRDKLHALGNVPRLQGAVARRPVREAMRLVLLVLLATAAFGQTHAASTCAGVWLPENLPGTEVLSTFGKRSSMAVLHQPKRGL